MFRRHARLIPFVIFVLLLSSAAFADTVTGDGSFQSGWTASTNGSTFFNNASWDGTGMNIGFCLAGGGNCNFSGQPGTAPAVFAGTNFSAPGAFSVTPSGAANSTLTLEVAGMSGSNEFGWYLVGTDPTDPANRHVLFTGPQGAGTVSNFNPSGAYGFYMLAGGTTLFTSTLYDGATNQQFAVFMQGGTLWIGVEDLSLQSGDRDYNDMIVKITPVPEPASLAYLGLGLVTLVGAMHRKFRMSQS